MTRAMKLLTLMAPLALVISGCSNNSNPVAPTAANVGSPTQAVQAVQAVPSDATIDSAHIMIFAAESDVHTVTFHRVTAPWDESTLTFNGLGGAFDLTPFASLNLVDSGWYSVDVTTEVNGWFDSTITNNGFLIAPQADTNLSTAFASQEHGSNAAYLVVCFTTFEGPCCDTLELTDDATVYTGAPDLNYGADSLLRIAQDSIPDSTYFSAIQFEFPIEIRYASLGDRVWLDDNKDGIQDEGEAGVEGVSVALYNCLDSSLVASTTTDADGNYGFTDLLAGDYFIEVTPPVDHGLSPADQGTDDSLDSDIVGMTGRSDCITLVPGEDFVDLDAGLVLFDACTRGKGYWKNHTGFGPQADEVTPLLPIWLGTPDGDKSLAVTDAQIAYDILQQHTYGHPRNGITKLYAHLLTAKLNVANYANPADIQDAIEDIDAFLTDYDWNDWGSLSKDDRKTVLQWRDKNESYNEGEIGPGECDDYDDDDDDDDYDDDDDDDDGDDDDDDDDHDDK